MRAPQKKISVIFCLFLKQGNRKYDSNFYIKKSKDFPGGAVVKNPPANAGDTGSSPGPGDRKSVV